MIDSAALRNETAWSASACGSDALAFPAVAPVNVHPMREAEAVRALLSHVRRGMKVLDLGCGAGWSTLLLAARCGPSASSQPRVVAWDFDDEARIATQCHVTRAGHDQRIRVMSAWPADERFDLVWCSHRIGIAADRDPALLTATLGRAAMLLRPGGRLAIALASDMLASGIAAIHRAGLVPMVLDTTAPVLLVDDLDAAGCSPTANGDFVLLAQTIDDRIALPVDVHTDQRSLLARFGLNDPGVLLEHDLDTIDNDCELHARKRRDAEVLCGLAASRPGPCLDIGTSHGRSAFKLATNIGDHTVTTVNMLPEQAVAAGLHITHVLQKDEIGSYPRQRGVRNICQLYANTLQWDWAGVPDRLHLAFVDGCHDTDAVLADSLQAWRRLTPGGFLVWHDFSPALAPVHPWIASSVAGVREFVQQVRASDTVQHLLGSWCGVLQKGYDDGC